MTTKIRVESQVEGFVKSLAPTPRRRLRMAIKGLATGRGNIKSLEGELAGYSRLAVSGFRIIFRQRMEKGTRIIECIYAERRAIIYEVFVGLLSEHLTD